MKITEATALIHTPLIEWTRPQSWCDLGSGSGTFTVALAQLLAPGSTIYAVDLDWRTLEAIPDQQDGVQIRKIVGDLQSSSLRLPPVGGILMANTWRHDVLGPLREIQTIILKTSESFFSPTNIDLHQMTVRRAPFKLLRAVLRAPAIVSPAAILSAGRVTDNPEVILGTS